MGGRRISLVTVAATTLAVSLSGYSDAASKGAHHINNRNGIKHVLLLSIDGMHALDFVNCSKGETPYCPNLAELAEHGTNYLDTSASKPSDSFPGLMAIVSGGSPRTVGAFYDVAYDRSLDPPAEDTGNGVKAGSCTPGAAPSGTSTEYEEGIDFDQDKLNGGAANGDGGVNSINANRLPRDPANGCAPVFPWNFVRTNTIFGVIHEAGGYTAWSDKHPAYASVAGPSNDAGTVDDFYGPEINSNSQDYPSSDIKVPGCNPLPDQAAVADGDDYTGSFQNIQCYDAIKVQAILNEIDGKTHNGAAKAPVPNLLGMNFQSVSVGQKLVYQHGTVATGYSVTGGYLDATGTPSPTLLQEIEFVDRSIGSMVSELKKQNLLSSSLIVITAKHGQSPIDPARILRIDGDVKGKGMSPATILDALLPPSEAPSGDQIGPTEDDVSLLWLADAKNTASAVETLETASPPLPLGSNIAGIGEIFWGPAIAPMFNLPGLPPNGDPRTPDIIVTTDVGVIYTGKRKKVAEHGGFAKDDTNVIMLVSNPRFAAKTVTSHVETTQVAPTILKAFGLDPNQLEAVQKEGTQELPGLSF
jgi:hypothetical protein